MRVQLKRLPVFTREGRVVAFLAMSVTTALIASGNLLLYFTLAVVLALLGIGFWYPFVNTWRIFVRRSVPPYAFAGEPVFIELALVNRKARAPSFAIVLKDDLGAGRGAGQAEMHVAVVAPGRAERVGYHLTISRRGHHSWRYICVRSSFPFLIFDRIQLIRFRSEMTVYPRPGRLLGPVLPAPVDSLRTSRRRSRGYQDFHKLREYRRGDDSRHIHWKSTARCTELLLREFDAEGGESVLVVLDSEPEGSLRVGDRQELAISFLITLARALWRQSYRVTVACYGQQFFQLQLSGQRADFHRLLQHLAHYQTRGEHSLVELLDAVRLRRKQETGLIVVTDRRSIEDAVARMWPSRAGVRVVSSNSPEFPTLFETTQGRVQW